MWKMMLNIDGKLRFRAKSEGRTSLQEYK